MANTDPSEWRLYASNLTTQTDILPFKSSHIDIVLNEAGSGEITFPLDTQAGTNVGVGQFAALYYRGSYRAGFFIDNLKYTDISGGENGERMVSISGRGALALLDQSVIWSTDSTTTTRTFTSVTKASILKTLIDEAQARGELAVLTYDFTASVDSASVAWTDSESYDLPVGTSLLDVARQFAGTGGFEYSLSFSGGIFNLSAYSAGIGSNISSTIYIRIGEQCEEVGRDTRGDEIYNDYLVKWKDGYITVSDSTSVTAYRRRTKFLSLEQAQSSASATTFASAKLSLTKDPKTNKTVKVYDGINPALFVDYDLGDTISLDRFGTVSSDKIVAIQADFDGTEFSHIVLDFNYLLYDNEMKLSGQLDWLTDQWNTAHDSDLLEVSQGLKIGTDGFVNAIHTYGDYIYIGGGFSIVNNLTVSYTARYQISTHTWAALTGITAAVIKIVDVSGTVYACTATKVYVLSGTAWSLVGTATAGNTLRCMASDGTSLYVGGNLTQMDAVTINGKVAKRTAGVWTDLNSNPISQFAESMAFFGSDLYIGFGGVGIGSSSLKLFSGGSYTNVLNLGGKYIFALKQVGSNLIIMSNDNNGGSVSTCAIYSWDGVSSGPGLGSAITLGTISDFLPVVTGVGNGSCSINNYLTDVYIGGDFDTIDSVTGFAGLARYSGGIWSPLGGGVSTAAGDGVTTIEIVDNDIYVGGVFTTAFGVTTRDLSVFITDFQSLVDHLANDYASFDMGAAIHSAAASAVTDSDEFPFWEDTSSDLRKITWANIKTTIGTALGAIIAALTGKTTPVDADVFAIGDSAASNASKSLTWANVKATMKTYLDAIYAPIAKGVTNGDAHNHDLGDGGTLSESAIALSDVTTINASTSAHGFLKKLSNVATEFMNGVGNWSGVTTPLQLGAHGLGTGIAASTTNWTCPNVGGLQASETAMLVTVAGTLKNLYIRIGSTQPASGSLVCTLRVNNADTALVVTIAAGSGAGNYSDTTHTVALSAGDRVGWKIVNNATGTSGIIGATVIELDVANV